MTNKFYQAFYKGTPHFSNINGDGSLERKEAKRAIEMFLREGQSLDKIKTFIKNQMDDLEEKRCLVNRLYPTDPDNGLRIYKKLTKMSVERIEYTWVRNVWILIILKVIEDDEMNGFVFYQKQGNTLVIIRNG